MSFCLIFIIYNLSFDSLAYTNKVAVMDFIRARIEKMMSSTISKDIKMAVLSGSTFIVPEMLATADALLVASQEDNYKAAVESLSRVFNLAEKADTSNQVDSSLFENDAEKELGKATKELALSGDARQKIEQLFALSTVIDNFFENTMVMVEDESVKSNRLALLAELTAKAKTLAVFNKLNAK